MSKSPATRRMSGRPPSGPSGEKVSLYPALTVRLPHETKDRLVALSTLRRIPMWQLLDTIVCAYVDALPADERRLLSQFTGRMTPRDEA